MTEYEWQSRFFLRSSLNWYSGWAEYNRLSQEPRRADYDSAWEYAAQLRRWCQHGAPKIVDEYPPMPEDPNAVVVVDTGDFEPCQRPGFAD